MDLSEILQSNDAETIDSAASLSQTSKFESVHHLHVRQVPIRCDY